LMPLNRHPLCLRRHLLFHITPPVAKSFHPVFVK